jgi:hypothetical protein
MDVTIQRCSGSNEHTTDSESEAVLITLDIIALMRSSPPMTSKIPSISVALTRAKCGVCGTGSEVLEVSLLAWTFAHQIRVLYIFTSFVFLSIETTYASEERKRYGYWPGRASRVEANVQYLIDTRS